MAMRISRPRSTRLVADDYWPDFGRALNSASARRAQTRSKAVKPAVDAARAECKKFVETFGERGAVWFAEGKSFTECCETYSAELSAREAQLKKELAQANRELAREANRFINAVGEPLAKTAAAIKLPGKRK